MDNKNMPSTPLALGAAIGNGLLARGARMGAVTLYAQNIDLLADFYQKGTGLDRLDSTLTNDAESSHEPRISLGKGSETIVNLVQRSDLSRAAQGSAGLFHTAILYPTEASLAAAVYATAQHFPGSFTGSSDHLVSKAFYFNDPEGNGVELYWDRPQSEWDIVPGGEIKMATLWLDPNEFLQTHLTEEAAAAADPASAGLSAAGILDSATVGHVHLQVGNIPEAENFYLSALGLNKTASYGSQALFASSNGYHHHLGMNTWNSAGAGTRSPALGLGQVNILVPDLDDVIRIQEGLRQEGHDTEFDGASITILDPWANQMRVSVG